MHLRPCEWKRPPVEPGHAALRVRRQRERLGLARSRLSFEPASARDSDLSLMERLDRLHLEYPFFGRRKLAVMLRSPGEAVNRKRVPRLMRVMGMRACFVGRKAQ